MKIVTFVVRLPAREQNISHKMHKKHKCFLIPFVLLVPFVAVLVSADHLADTLAALLLLRYLGWCLLRVTPVVEDADLVHAL